MYQVLVDLNGVKLHMLGCINAHRMVIKTTYTLTLYAIYNFQCYKHDLISSLYVPNVYHAPASLLNFKRTTTCIGTEFTINMINASVNHVNTNTKLYVVKLLQQSIHTVMLSLLFTLAQLCNLCTKCNTL